jgi:uncharacterized protein (UPF0261 family)
MIDVQTWAALPKAYEDRPYYAHNRLIASVTSTVEERRNLARLIADKLQKSRGPTALLLPLRGLHAWDTPGQPLHDAQAHAAYMAEFRSRIKPPVELTELDMHINDAEFSAKALDVFDRWVSEGLIPAGVQ